jgi:pimeloyl-ACP methyl ester carboxylesterase
LIDASGANEVTLIGHDWGGALAWLFALRAVRPLERLVVMNLPHPARFYEHLMNDRAQQKRSRYERFFQIPWLPDWLLSRNHASAIGRMFGEGLTRSDAMSEADVRVFRENAAARGAMTAMLNWYRANPFREAFAAEFAMLETPTLMIWGVNDIALGQEMTLGTGEIVRDFTLRYLDASHSVQQDAPDETNAILEAWLTGREVPEFLVPNSGPAR